MLVLLVFELFKRASLGKKKLALIKDPNSVSQAGYAGL